MNKKTMHAMVLTGHGGFEVLEYRADWPVPVPAHNQVLVRVKACGLNNTDINTRTGWYSKGVSEGTSTDGGASGADDDDASWGGAPLTFPRIQGADVAGEVVEIGEGADASLMGQRVLIDTWLRDWDDPDNLNKVGYFGSEADGGYAEYCVVDYRQVHAVQSSLSDAELATFATSYVTAENMLNRARVTAGDTVLITGASGGVGSALIQLAARRGAKTIGMAGPSKSEEVKAIGADHVIDRSPRNLCAALKDATGNDKVSVVADVVGGDIFPDLIEALERGGRYTCSGAIAGPIVSLDLRTLYLADLTFTGATVVPPGTFGDLVGYIERCEIKPLLAAKFPLEDLQKAQEMFMAKGHVGNIVVTMG